MKTIIQETDLYKSFIKALDIHDMTADDNSFVVKCCKIAEEYHSQLTSKDLITDDDIIGWANEVQLERGGFIVDYIFAAKAMRGNKIIHQ